MLMNYIRFRTVSSCKLKDVFCLLCSQQLVFHFHMSISVAIDYRGLDEWSGSGGGSCCFSCSDYLITRKHWNIIKWKDADCLQKWWIFNWVITNELQVKYIFPILYTMKPTLMMMWPGSVWAETALSSFIQSDSGQRQEVWMLECGASPLGSPWHFALGLLFLSLWVLLLRNNVTL